MLLWLVVPGKTILSLELICSLEGGSHLGNIKIRIQSHCFEEKNRRNFPLWLASFGKGSSATGRNMCGCLQLPIAAASAEDWHTSPTYPTSAGLEGLGPHTFCVEETQGSERPVMYSRAHSPRPAVLVPSQDEPLTKLLIGYTFYDSSFPVIQNRKNKPKSE